MKLVITVLLLLVPNAAWAINVQWCARAATTFVDVTTSGGDDYYQDNPTDGRRVLGALVKVVQNGVTLSNAFTSDSTGCTAFISVADAGLITVTIYSIATVQNNTMYVYTTDGGAVQSYAGDYLGSTLTNNQTLDLKASASADWNTIVAVAWAMSRRTAGLSSEMLTFYTDNCPSGTFGGCFVPSTEKIFVTTGASSKHLIVHEMGHAMAYQAAGEVSPVYNTSWNNTQSGCQSSSGGSHSVDSDEYQVVAFSEGIASFYSSVAFNNTSEANCFRQEGYSVDWNDDGNFESAWYSCAGAEPGGSNAKDFWWNGSDGSGPLKCKLSDTQIYNLGTEYDWNRFLWDLDTTQGMVFDDIYAIYADSDPGSWSFSGHGWSSANFPSYELWQSAIDLGFQTEWEAEWDNGPIR